MGLESCPRVHLDRRGRVNSYFVCGSLGVIAAIATGLLLGSWRSLPYQAIIVAVVTPLPAFLLTIKLRYIILGNDSLVLYEKLVAVLVASAAVLHLSGQPILVGLDLVTLGVGAFLVFGRIGCFLVGCCHGRPHHRGIPYGDEHAALLPDYLVGIRLLPVQLIEAGITAMLVVAGIVLFLADHRPGEVMALWVSGYGVARFVLELWRGDAARPYALGLSEAQWFAVVLGWATVWLGFEQSLELTHLYVALAVASTIASNALAVASRRTLSVRALQQPRRMRELADALIELRNNAGETPAVVTLASGLSLSYSEHGQLIHLGVSAGTSSLSVKAANEIAYQLAWLTGRLGSYHVQPGKLAGMFHIHLLDPAGPDVMVGNGTEKGAFS